MEKKEEDKEEITEATPLGMENDNQRPAPPQHYYPPPAYYPPPPNYYAGPAYPAQPNPAYSGYQSYPPPPPPADPNHRVDSAYEDLIRKRSKQLYCPNCRRYGWTRVTLKTGLINHLCCGYLCLIGCWLCCWIPYCCDECKDAEHFCEYCNSLLKNEHPV